MEVVDKQSPKEVHLSNHKKPIQPNEPLYFRRGFGETSSKPNKIYTKFNRRFHVHNPDCEKVQRLQFQKSCLV